MHQFNSQGAHRSDRPESRAAEKTGTMQYAEGQLRVHSSLTSPSTQERSTGCQ
jgi:hypothetical protein